MIVLAANESASCRRAASRVAELFGDADVIVATVVPGRRTADRSAAGTVRALVDELARDSAIDVLRQVCDVVGPRARARLLTGDTATSLCELARAVRAEAIVVGSLAGDSVLGAVRGSVASQIADAAPCSVLELGR